MDFTFGSLLTDEGKLKFYLGEGKFTDDPIPDDFFGCAGVAEIAHLQDVLLHIGRQRPSPPRERDAGLGASAVARGVGALSRL